MRPILTLLQTFIVGVFLAFCIDAVAAGDGRHAAWFALVASINAISLAYRIGADIAGLDD